MSGPRLAKAYVSDYLVNDLPARLQVYRTHWGLTSRQLPTPHKYLTYEPFALDTWPTIITMAISTQDITRTDYAVDADPVFRVTYQMRTYVWVRDSGAQLVTDQRDNLVAVVREALMDGPSLSAYDSSVPCYPKVDESTIREEFSDLTLIKGERLLAGAYVAYDLSLEEVVDHSPYGVMQSTELTVNKMPITANAPTRLVAIAGVGEATLAWYESTWNGGVFDISGYNIQKSVDSGLTWTTVTADTGSVETSFVASGLTAGVEHIFRVASVNQAGVGAYSASSTAVVPSPS